MRKYAFLFLCLLFLFALSACGQSEPLDLSGTWIENTDNDTYHEAIITADTITIYWVSNGGENKALYWAGSFVPPTDGAKEYKWASENDKEQTDTALLASGDDTKDFEYKNGEITYATSAMGMTKTVHLNRAE